MTRELVVIGASAVALEVADVARSLGRRIRVAVDETLTSDSYLFDIDCTVSNSLGGWIDKDDFDVVLAIGDNHSREAVYQRVRSRVHAERFVNLIHPNATVSSYARLGVGAIVLAGTCVGPSATLGDFAYLNANAIVSHHCRLGDFVSMSPGAAIAGRVEVGARSSLGMNSSVRERCVIGEDVVVGANSFVNHDTPSQVILIGAPAQVLRHRVPGERYLR